MEILDKKDENDLKVVFQPCWWQGMITQFVIYLYV